MRYILASGKQIPTLRRGNMKNLFVLLMTTLSLSAFANPTRDISVDCSLSTEVVEGEFELQHLRVESRGGEVAEARVTFSNGIEASIVLNAGFYGNAFFDDLSINLEVVDEIGVWSIGEYTTTEDTFDSYGNLGFFTKRKVNSMCSLSLL